MRKEVKEFFEPTWLKIILTIFLIVFLSLICWNLLSKYYGPLGACLALGCPTPSSPHRYVAHEIFPFLFVPIIILSYLISCVITKLIKLVKKRVEK